jgi:DNA-binding response OmpR family regulator
LRARLQLKRGRVACDIVVPAQAVSNGGMAHRTLAPTVLVIDADEPMRALVQEWLAGAGYAARGRAAPGASGEADVALVVLDLCDLPATGAAAVGRVKTLFPAAAVLGLSTQASRPIAAAVLDGLAPGLAALLPKPCSRTELLAAVAEALRPGAEDAAFPASATRPRR